MVALRKFQGAAASLQAMGTPDSEKCQTKHMAAVQNGQGHLSQRYGLLEAWKQHQAHQEPESKTEFTANAGSSQCDEALRPPSQAYRGSSLEAHVRAICDQQIVSI